MAKKKLPKPVFIGDLEKKHPERGVLARSHDNYYIIEIVRKRRGHPPKTLTAIEIKNILIAAVSKMENPKDCRYFVSGIQKDRGGVEFHTNDTPGDGISDS